MKKHTKLTLLFVTLLPVSMATIAETPQKPMSPTSDMKMAPGMMGKHRAMGMMNNMTDEQIEQHFRMMQEQMLAIHDLSNQILAESDPAKKAKLKDQQLQLMKTHHAQMMEHRMEKMQQHQLKMQSMDSEKK